MKIHPVAADLFHADERKDRHDEANSRITQFCKAPKSDKLPVPSFWPKCVILYNIENATVTLGWSVNALTACDEYKYAGNG
jgi:hypothetical protein